MSVLYFLCFGYKAPTFKHAYSFPADVKTIDSSLLLFLFFPVYSAVELK